MNVNCRKMKKTDFQLFSNGKFNAGWPIGYNFLLGMVDRDYPKKEEAGVKVNYHVEILI